MPSPGWESWESHREPTPYPGHGHVLPAVGLLCWTAQTAPGSRNVQDGSKGEGTRSRGSDSGERRWAFC